MQRCESQDEFHSMIRSQAFYCRFQEMHRDHEIMPIRQVLLRMGELLITKFGASPFWIYLLQLVA